jgi:hypothetical protein
VPGRAARQHQGPPAGRARGDDRVRAGRCADVADGGGDDLRRDRPLRPARRVPLALQHVTERALALVRPLRSPARSRQPWAARWRGVQGPRLRAADRSPPTMGRSGARWAWATSCCTNRSAPTSR